MQFTQNYQQDILGCELIVKINFKITSLRDSQLFTIPDSNNNVSQSGLIIECAITT